MVCFLGSQLTLIYCSQSWKWGTVLELYIVGCSMCWSRVSSCIHPSQDTGHFWAAVLHCAFHPSISHVVALVYQTGCWVPVLCPVSCGLLAKATEPKSSVMLVVRPCLRSRGALSFSGKVKGIVMGQKRQKALRLPRSVLETNLLYVNKKGEMQILRWEQIYM